MHLMGRVHKWYILDKLSRRNMFLIDASKRQTIKAIEDNGWEHYGSEKNWEYFKQEILDIDSCVSEGTFFRMVNDIMPDIDWDSIKIEKDYPYGAKVVADLFEKYVQPKIREDFPQ